MPCAVSQKIPRPSQEERIGLQKILIDFAMSDLDNEYRSAALGWIVANKEIDMLILTRRLGEKLRIATDLSTTVLEVHGNQVRLGIGAPKSVTIHREEIFQRIVQAQHQEVDLQQVPAELAAPTLKVSVKRVRRRSP